MSGFMVYYYRKVKKTKKARYNQMTDKQMELVKQAMDEIAKRATDFNRSNDSRLAYDSAYTMLAYALEENQECLNQFV